MIIKYALPISLTCLLTLLQLCFSVQAATVSITSNLDDDGAGCTLREAIAGINDPTAAAVQNNGCILGNGNNDTINFDLTFPAVIEITQELLNISNPLTIDGPGADQLTIDGTGLVRNGGGLSVTGLFSIRADDVTLSQFSVQNVRASTTLGYAISIQGRENLKVLNCKFTNNALSSAVIRISQSSNILISGSEFVNNFSSSVGGAIAIGESSGIIENSIFLNNNSELDGGAISLRNSSDLTIRGSFFSGNQAGRRGGAISLFDNQIPFNIALLPGGRAITKIINSTFTENVVNTNNNALVNGNVISIEMENNFVELTNNSIINNGDPSTGNSSIVARTQGAFSDFPPNNLLIYNNIIAGNLAASGAPAAFMFIGPDTSSIQSSGNIIGDFSRTVTEEMNEMIPGVNFLTSSDRRAIPLSQIVSSLGNNGGPTLTFPLAKNSIAVNSGIRNVCPAVDQRSIVRINSEEDACDIGAFEDTIQGPVIGVREEDEPFEDESFFVIPAKNGNSVIFSL